MEKTHWKRLVNSDYLGAYSLNEGQEPVLTIKSVAQETVVGVNGKKEICTVCRFAEKEKPMILNRTNMKTITKIYESPYVEDWSGRKIQIFQSTTKFGGEVVECLRIRPFIPKSNDAVACEGCGCIIEDFVNPKDGKTLPARLVAERTLKTYGKVLCSECASVEAARKKAEAEKSDTLKGGSAE